MKPHLNTRLSPGLTPAALARVLTLLLAVQLCSAAGLGFLENSALVALTDEDRKLQLVAALNALGSAEEHKQVDWKNPQSGASGTVEARGRYTADDGLHCRRLSLLTQAKGIESRFVFPACQDSNGQWFIASGKKINGM
jgi:surface antigen